MFRSEKYVERYEDVVFELETPLNTVVANNAYQKKDSYRFVADNTGEITPFDWFNSRLLVDFKVNRVSNGASIGLNDFNGMVNGSYSLINNFKVNLNGKKVYDLNDANHRVNIKNLLEYSPSYANSIASNEFFYLGTSRNADPRELEVSGINQLAKRKSEYNKGFAARKALLGESATVTVEIPLNRYSFFEALRDQLLPNTRVEINIELESDSNLIWQAGFNCRVIVTKLQYYTFLVLFLILKVNHFMLVNTSRIKNGHI